MGSWVVYEGYGDTFHENSEITLPRSSFMGVSFISELKGSRPTFKRMVGVEPRIPRLEIMVLPGLYYLRMFSGNEEK